MNKIILSIIISTMATILSAILQYEFYFEKKRNGISVEHKEIMKNIQKYEEK